MTTSPLPGPGALDELQRVEAAVAVRDREAEVRRSAVHDRLAVVADELRLAVDAPFGLGDVGQVPDLWRSDWSNDGSVAPLPSLRSKADLPLMTAFEPWRLSVKMLSKARSIESVRT